ncbi:MULTISPECIES: chemotaxis protein CheC [Halorussus]|uniref:chemotaxis protein CheC n=1 Tax=Halorussus TaxID=1070314 RepID=UPI0020A15803|nr:chemotaxis protein CheC [Halorussus vallis]USZ74505.1 chemotaxis protein CheC [Halorussus vallis]
MKLDVDSLGTFYEMAREGAGLAADRLSSMTGIPARVEVTHLNFTRDGTVASDLGDGEWVGVRVGLTDGFEGTSLLLFDAESARTVTSAAIEGVEPVAGESLHESAVTEIGQVMNNGFVDGWANVLDTNIDVSAPTYVTADELGGVLADSTPTPAADELAVLFRNSFEAVGEELTFRHYLLPARDTVERLFAARSPARAIEFEKLVGFDRIAQRGAAQVARNLTRMSGIEMDVDIRRIDFVSLDAIPSEVSPEPMVGVAFSFAGLPSGYLLFLFDERSARRLGGTDPEAPSSPDSETAPPADAPRAAPESGAALGTETDAASGEVPATGLGEFQRDAIKELSNVMASGMLDGWANLLDTTIDHSPPAYAHDMGAAVVDPLVVGLGASQEFAFVFDTCVEAVDGEVDLDIYVIPDEADLKEALGSFDLDRVADTRPEASTELPDVDVDLDRLDWEAL